MRKFTFGEFTLEFDETLVSDFEENVPDSFVNCIKGYLQTDFQCLSIPEIFRRYSIEDIQNVVINAAKQEIALYKGEGNAIC